MKTSSSRSRKGRAGVSIMLASHSLFPLPHLTVAPSQGQKGEITQNLRLVIESDERCSGNSAINARALAMGQTLRLALGATVAGRSSGLTSQEAVRMNQEIPCGNSALMETE